MSIDRRIRSARLARLADYCNESAARLERLAVTARARAEREIAANARLTERAIGRMEQAVDSADLSEDEAAYLGIEAGVDPVEVGTDLGMTRSEVIAAHGRIEALLERFEPADLE